MNQFVKLLDPHHSKDSVDVKFKMSITSSTTTSRDCDVPSAKVVFRDKLCLVSITRRDDTPMDASSISEEDVIEICVMKGHTHPLDVLHYSAMESVVLFHSPDKLQCTTRGIIKTTEFWSEAITVRAMAPLVAHVTEYLAMSCTNPSNGERELHTPPQQTPPTGGTPHHLQVELGYLANHELHQLVEDLMQEIVQCEIHMPPAIPLQMNGYAHWAVESLRWMTRRSPFQEGEGGVHWGNPLHLQSQSNWLEEGFPLDHPHKCHALLHLCQIWGNWLPPWNWVCT